MDKIRDLMERAVGTCASAPDAMTRIQLRARRRARLRTSAVIAFSFLVFIGGGSVLYVAWGRGGPSMGLAPSDSPQSRVRFAETHLIAVGATGDVYRVTSSFGSVWVSGGSAAGGYVARVDPASRQITARIPTVSGTAIAVSSQGVWVAGAASTFGEGDGTLLQLVDPATNEVVRSFSLGETHGVALAATDAGLWVAVADAPDGHHAHVDFLDPTSGDAVTRLDLPDGTPTAMFALGGAVWIAQRQLHEGAYVGDNLTYVDPTDPSTASQITDFSTPTPGADGVMWGVRFESGGRSTLASLDTSSRTVTTYANVHPAPLGGGLAWDGESLWYVSEGALSRFNPSSGTSEPVPISEGVIDLVARDRTIWLLGFRGTLSTIEPNSQASKA